MNEQAKGHRFPVADQKQVEILNKGVAEWNEWRRSVSIRPDLSGADLRFTDLGFASLYRADLSGADLDHARLHHAELSDAHLSGANLSNAWLEDALLIDAYLNGADLSRANLRNARLNGADLSYAKLDRTELNGASMEWANLTGAFLQETVFVDVNLTRAIGLETCRHVGPSIIDHLTLEQSGLLPLPFLRGVGVSNKIIEALQALFLDQARQHHSCFISYSSKDQEFAERLHADLQNKGVRCWFAPHDLPIGAKTWNAIDEEIKLRDKLLLILSKNSIDSGWVEDEVQRAFAEERDRKQTVLFPVRIDDAVMETPEPWARKLRDQRNIGDFQRWKDHDAYKESFERVLRDLTIKS